MIQLMRLLILALLISFVHGATSPQSPQYVHDTCTGENSDSSSLIFHANLNDTLLNQLLPKASERNFYTSTTGTGTDQVNALFYCKGDVDSKTCQDCVQAAISKMTDVCKFPKEGIVWFEECTLRYSNRTIFGVDKEEPRYRYYNTSGDVPDIDLDPYQSIFDSKMKSLIDQAAYTNGTLVPGCYTIEFNISSTQIIRGLAQCTPDIVGSSCYRCLSTALRVRDTWANTMVFLPSCFLRYDLYGSAPPPPPPSPRRSLPVRSIVLIAVFSAIFVLLLVVGSIWFCCLKGEIVGTLKKSALISLKITTLPQCFKEFTQTPPYSEAKSLRGEVGGDRKREHVSNRTTVIEEPPVAKAKTGGPGRTVHGFQKYTFSQLEQMTNGFRQEIGKGAYGVVYKGLLLDGSKEVAVKMLNENDAPKQFNNEIDVFGRISHKNLVSLLGYCKDGPKLGLVYEYMDKRDLRYHLAENAGSLSWTNRLEIAIGTAEGLHYLHNHCEELIVHRDMKPDNILLSGEGEKLHAKVADFGLSKIFPAEDATTIETRVIGTRGYTAPEYHRTGLLNEKADVYSFGVVLVELTMGLSPRYGFDLVAHFKEMFYTADIEKILDPRVKRDLNYGSVWEATELARSCIDIDQRKRPDMWEIVVKLKQCLKMETNKNNAAIPSIGSTSIEMMSAMSSISMVPDAR